MSIFITRDMLSKSRDVTEPFVRFAQHGIDPGAKTTDIPDDAFLSTRASRSKGELLMLESADLICVM